MERGIDVSSYQGSVDWQAARGAGVAFGFAKATEGTQHTDSFFHRNWRELRAAGIARGAYHFFLPEEDAQLQARHFLSAVPFAAGDLPAVLDVERPASRREALADGIRAWLSVVEEETHRKPLIYTSPGFWDAYGTADFGEYPLWVAHYTPNDQPRVPEPWRTWTFWQSSQSGRNPGVNGTVDLDRFNGTAGDLAALAGPVTPRLILAAPGGNGWRYLAVNSSFEDDQFYVTSATLARALGIPGGTDMSQPLRSAVSQLGWNATFATEHLADVEDPRVYVFVANAGGEP